VSNDFSAFFLKELLMANESAINERAVAMAKDALARKTNADPNQIACIECSRERIPGIPDGQVHIAPVSYKYNVLLGYRSVQYFFQVTGGQANFISQT
jgi:hypothetical protein